MFDPSLEIESVFPAWFSGRRWAFRRCWQELSISPFDLNKHKQANRINADTDEDDTKAAKKLGNICDHLTTSLHEKNSKRSHHGKKNAAHHDGYRDEDGVAYFLHLVHRFKRRRIEQIDQPDKDGK